MRFELFLGQGLVFEGPPHISPLLLLAIDGHVRRLALAVTPSHWMRFVHVILQVRGLYVKKVMSVRMNDRRQAETQRGNV